MSAGWAKNEITAAKRRCDLIITSESGTPAPPGTDFIALGLVFISGVTQPKYALAVGTMTNKRRPLIIADFSTTATDTANDRATKVGHGFETGDRPIRSNTTVGGVDAATDYWLIKFDADQFSLATSLANAYAGTKIDLTASINAAVFSDVAGTERGIWGEFTYEATQAETNHDGKETVVMVDGPSYRRMLFCGAFTTVMMQEAAATAFNQTGEGAYTYGDLIRLLVAVCFGKVGNYTAPPYSFKALDGVKVRATNNADATGRLTAVVGDLTP